MGEEEREKCHRGAHLFPRIEKENHLGSSPARGRQHFNALFLYQTFVRRKVLKLFSQVANCVFRSSLTQFKNTSSLLQRPLSLFFARHKSLGLKSSSVLAGPHHQLGLTTPASSPWNMLTMASVSLLHRKMLPQSEPETTNSSDGP